MNKRIGFIGTGAMGSAMIKAIISKKAANPSDIIASDADRIKLKEIADETGINIATSNIEVVNRSDIVILAVKPNIVEQVLKECKSGFREGKILVSFAVGIPIRFYKSIIGDNAKIIRTMPNTPMLVGEGMTLLSYDKSISDAEITAISGLFNCVGETEILDENLMNEVTALTGSSPAYVYLFIEAMADAAVLSGIPRNMAYRLAAQSILGSAKLLLETGKHPAELKDQVCSPAGTTIEAVAALEKNGFRHAVIDAMNKCTKRATEISRYFLSCNNMTEE